MHNRPNRNQFLAGDMFLGDEESRKSNRSKDGVSTAEQNQQQALKRKQELIRIVGAHMNTCQTCQTYGYNRCRALKELQDRHQ